MAALAPARPLVARVDISQNPEEIAADLLDIWNAVEVGMRALLGGSALGGQPLVQELRQRNMISIEQAHSLLDFLAARDRVKRTEYRPTSADIEAARTAYTRLDEGLRAEAASAGASTTATAAAPVGTSATVVPTPVPPARRSRIPWLPIVALLLVLGDAGAVAPALRDRLVAAVPSARIETIPGATHFAALERPREVGAAIGRFAAERA